MFSCQGKSFQVPRKLIALRPCRVNSVYLKPLDGWQRTGYLDTQVNKYLEYNVARRYVNLSYNFQLIMNVRESLTHANFGLP